SIIVILISTVGMLQMGTNSYMMDDMKESEQMKKDFDFFDDNFGGIRPFELSVQLKNKDAEVWDKDVLQSLDSVETYLEKEFGVTVKSSLVMLMKTLNRASHAGNKEEYKLPSS